MLKNLAQYVCSGGLAAAALLAPAAQAAEPGPRLVVAIRDYTRMPRETLDAAEAQASRIYSKAGVAIEWWELPPPGSAAVDLAAAKPALYVVLLPDSMAVRLRCSRGAFGFALADRVYVFADRARQAAAQTESDFAGALGLVMAHELGHVLLVPNGHAPGSIMSPRFGKMAFGQGERGALLFHPAQAKRIRDRLLARQAAETAVLVAQR